MYVFSRAGARPGGWSQIRRVASGACGESSGTREIRRELADASANPKYRTASSESEHLISCGIGRIRDRIWRIYSPGPWLGPNPPELDLRHGCARVGQV